MLDISNYYEQLVTDHLWKMTENAAEPLTQTFVEDVACLALNKLPPCYVRNLVDKGADISEQDYREMNEAVDRAIADAVERVRRYPHLRETG